jgi:hypothetical protein
MKSFSVIGFFTVVVVGCVSLLTVREPRITKIDRDSASQISGSGDPNWCYPYSTGCDGTDSSCPTNSSCSVFYAECGVKTRYYNPEECRTDFGNEYCANRAQKIVLCSTTAKCRCWPQAGGWECKEDPTSLAKVTSNIMTSDDCRYETP